MAKADSVADAFKKLGTMNLEEIDEYLPTGSIVFDTVISNGKGIPRKKFIQLSSESGLGKSTLSLAICKSLCTRGYVCAYFDIEKGLNQSQIKGVGLDKYLDTLFFWYRISTFEEAEEILSKVIVDDDSFALIIVDSITGLIPQKMLESGIEKIEPGLQARYSSTFLMKWKAIMEKNKCKATWLFINQMRTKISFLRGSTYEAAGGSAQKFYMDIRLMMASPKKLNKITNTIEGRVEVPYGAESDLWAEKNRHARPFVKAKITIVFGKGVSNIAAYQRWLEQKSIITGGTGGWFSIAFPEREVTKVRGTVELNKWIRENIKDVKEYIESCGGFLLISEEGES